MLRFITLTAFATAALGGVSRDPSFPFKLDGRIVGGRDAEIEEFPHQLSLERSGFHSCGASIISENVAVTAAHCTTGVSASSFRVRAGSSIEGSGGQVVQVAQIIENPEYNSVKGDNDCTILILAEPLILGPGVQPIALPSDDQEVAVGTNSVVTGWGALRESGPSPSKLQAVEVPIVDRQVCREAYSQVSSRNITENMICAGVTAGGKDSCQGDSGGPLVIDNVLTGIVSWGYGCARPNYPGVYVNVPSQRAFIRDASGI